MALGMALKVDSSRHQDISHKASRVMHWRKASGETPVYTEKLTPELALWVSVLRTVVEDLTGTTPPQHIRSMRSKKRNEIQIRAQLKQEAKEFLDSEFCEEMRDLVAAYL